MKALPIVIIVLVLAAAGAWAAGSIISSFELTPYAEPYATGIYRDGTYIYGLLYSSGVDYMRRYTAGGSVVNSSTLPGMNVPRDGDQSLLGAGYLDIIDGATNKLMTYTTAGSLVRSKAIPSDAEAFAYAPAGDYYYLARSASVFRYTLGGSLVRSFYVGGTIRGLAAMKYTDSYNGEVVIVGRAGVPGYTYVYTAHGRLLDAFVVPGSGGTYGSCCGPGAPASYGTTYWCNQHMGNARWAYQVDLSDLGDAVAPASVGNIKALFR